MYYPTGSESGFHFLQNFQVCARLWYYQNVLGLVPKYPGVKLLYGIALHKGLEVWYNNVGVPTMDRKQLMLDAFHEELQKMRHLFSSSTALEEVTSTGLTILRLYADRYSFEMFEVVGTEISLEHVFASGVKLTGRLDLVVKKPTGIEIMDHKSTGWSISQLSRSLSVSDQVNCYLFLWNQNHPDQPTYNVTFNILRQNKSVINLERVPFTKTPQDVEEFADGAEYLLNRLRKKATTGDTVWPKNTDSCFRYNHECEFFDVCKGANYAALLDVKYYRKDQLND